MNVSQSAACTSRSQTCLILWNLSSKQEQSLRLKKRCFPRATFTDCYSFFSFLPCASTFRHLQLHHELSLSLGLSGSLLSQEIKVDQRADRPQSSGQSPRDTAPTAPQPFTTRPARPPPPPDAGRRATIPVGRGARGEKIIADFSNGSVIGSEYYISLQQAWEKISADLIGPTAPNGGFVPVAGQVIPSAPWTFAFKASEANVVPYSKLFAAVSALVHDPDPTHPWANRVEWSYTTDNGAKVVATGVITKSGS